MKPPTYKKRRLVVRIKPGGFLRIPPSFLRRSGWRAGDVLMCEAADGCIRLFKPPTESAWRIERLRLRIARLSAGRENGNISVPCQPPDSIAEEQLLEGMIGQMNKTSAMAIAAVDEALASMVASDRRIAWRES